jgi:hypothetical protein
MEHEAAARLTVHQDRCKAEMAALTWQREQILEMFAEARGLLDEQRAGLHGILEQHSEDLILKRRDVEQKLETLTQVCYKPCSTCWRCMLNVGDAMLDAR